MGGLSRETGEKVRGNAGENDRAPRRWLPLFAFLLALPAAALLGFGVGLRILAPKVPALPILGKAPDYTLENQFGQRVSSQSLGGKVEIVTFLFPYCSTFCPLIAAHLADFENLVVRPAGIEKEIAILSFNLDPAGSGPVQMQAFLRQYGWSAKDRNWQFLTGSPEAIRRVVRGGFGVYYKRVPLAAEAGSNPPLVAPEVVNPLAIKAHIDYDIVHNDVIEILDRKGRIRKIVDEADTVGWRALSNLVRTLLAPSTRPLLLNRSSSSRR